MNRLPKLGFYLVLFVLMGLVTPGVSDSFVASGNYPVIITDVYATGYYCVLNSELDGSQTVNGTISNNTYVLKASFLYGGFGVAMQGTGKTTHEGDYIKYTGGSGGFVHISGPNAGRNLDGEWVVNPQTLRSRYARLGITDFTGFGNLALLHPDRATFAIVSTVAGSSGQTLTPWLSIAVDPSLIPPGQTGLISFKNGYTALYSNSQTTFRADDVGSTVKGKHIDIYLGEGQAAYESWLNSGGNRYVDIYLQ
jgi:3D (Asp-Asp-Asp) domain-containing protein